MEHKENDISRGFKLGCGGAVGVIAALTAIPLLMLGGCLFLGAGSYVASENAKNEEAMAQPRAIRLCAQHASVYLSDTTGYARLQDAVSAAAGQKVDSGTKRIESGTHARVLGTGKENHRRVELDSGERWWVPGEVTCETD